MKKIIKLINKLLDLIKYYILNFVNMFITKEDNYISFGSWHGKNYTDNPRYLFEHLLRLDKGYKLIWIGEKQIEEQLPNNSNVIFCKMNSLKSIYYIMKSRYVVFCQSTNDLYYINVYKNTIKIFLDHGIPVKKWGLDDQRRVSGEIKDPSIFTKFYRLVTGGQIKYDYFISSSPLNTTCLCSAMEDYGAKKENIIKSGTPRNDFLFHYKDKNNQLIKEKYARILDFDSSKKVVLYAPTYRRTNTKIESFYERRQDDIKYLKEVLNKHGAILIEKNHFATYNQNSLCEERDKDNVIIKLPMNNIINIQEMLLFTDVLISDYSGVFLDFTILNKPIIHYAFDYEYYRDIDSGLYYDINDFSAGRVTKCFEETCREIDNLLSGIDMYKSKRKYVREKYLEYENGDASEIICNHIFFNETNNYIK